LLPGVAGVIDPLTDPIETPIFAIDLNMIQIVYLAAELVIFEFFTFKASVKLSKFVFDSLYFFQAHSGFSPDVRNL